MTDHEIFLRVKGGNTYEFLEWFAAEWIEFIARQPRQRVSACLTRGAMLANLKIDFNIWLKSKYGIK